MNPLLTQTQREQSAQPPEDELLQLREEVQMIRTDTAVRRLLARPGAGVITQEEFQRETGIVFRGERFVVLEFTDDPSFPPPRPQRDDGASFRARNCELRQLVLSVLGREHIAVLCNQNGRLCCVLNWQGEDTTWLAACSGLLEELNALLWAGVGFRFQCVVSRMHRGADVLHLAEQELEQAQSYRSLIGGKSPVLFYDGILRPIERPSGQPRQEEQALLRTFHEAIRRGDFEGAKEIFSRVLQRNLDEAAPSVKTVQLRLYSIIDDTMEIFVRVGSDMGIQQELRSLDVAPRLLEAENIPALQDVVDELLDELQELLGENGQLARLPRQIRQYICDRYADPDLNVNQVADHFGVTATYATRAFKQQFGIGILSCIQQVRVEQAKRLLRSGQTVREVSIQVGYRDPATLSRLFKRLEGVTPARFGTIERE